MSSCSPNDDIAASLLADADNLISQGLPHKAETLLRRVLAINETKFGIGHVCTIESVLRCSRVLQLQGKLLDACVLCRMEIARAERALDKPSRWHQGLCLLLMEYSELSLLKGDRTKSEELFCHCIQTITKAIHDKQRKFSDVPIIMFVRCYCERARCLFELGGELESAISVMHKGRDFLLTQCKRVNSNSVYALIVSVNLQLAELLQLSFEKQKLSDRIEQQNVPSCSQGTPVSDKDEKIGMNREKLVNTSSKVVLLLREAHGLLSKLDIPECEKEQQKQRIKTGLRAELKRFKGETGSIKGTATLESTSPNYEWTMQRTATGQPYFVRRGLEKQTWMDASASKDVDLALEIRDIKKDKDGDTTSLKRGWGSLSSIISSVSNLTRSVSNTSLSSLASSYATAKSFLTTKEDEKLLPMNMDDLQIL
eukprot:m.110546 g.110546  ORF g.110546 m.110546 type:complete len:426 (+) comp14043_c0_seq2:277-1554(+)